MAYDLEIEGLVRYKQKLEAENDRLRATLRQIELNSREGDPLVKKLGWIAREALTHQHDAALDPRFVDLLTEASRSPDDEP